MPFQAACHQVAQLHGLPILTVVFNNGRWQAVKRATLGMYPDGLAATANEMPLTQLGPAPDYAAIARAHGAHAEKVEAASDLRGAVQRVVGQHHEANGHAQLPFDISPRDSSCRHPR